MQVLKRVNIQILNDLVAKRIPITQNDTCRCIECNITDWTIPDGATARIWALKPSKKLVYNDCQIEGNTVIAPITNQTSAEAGQTCCKIEFSKDGSKVSSFRFVLDVKTDISGNGTESKNESTVLEKMFEDLASAVTTATANANTATENANLATQKANSAAERAETAIWNNKNLTERHIGSSIKVEDTVSSSAVIREIKGVTEQCTTNGYQLLDQSKFPNKTQGGATLKNNGDGSFTVSGSGTFTEEFLHSYLFEGVADIKVGKLAISGSGTGLKTYFRLLDASGATITELFGNGSVNITADIVSKLSAIRFGIIGRAGTAIVAETCKPIIYQDGDGTFEQFTGCKASPSPDYPQEINSVGALNPATGKYEVKVKAHGKNLFDIKKALVGSFDSNGDFKVNNTTKKFYDFNFKENTQYTLSATVKQTVEGGNIRFRIKYTDGTENDKVLFNSDTLTYFSLQHTTLVEKTVEGIYVTYGSTGDVLIKDGKLQIEEGSTATTYEPYRSSLATIELDSPRYEGDRIFLEDGDVWVEREDAVVEFGAGASFIKGSVDRDGVFNVARRINEALPESNPMCTHFYAYAFGNEWIKKNNIMISASCNCNIVLDKNEFADASAFNNWIASNPIKVVYKLAEPTKEKLSQSAIYGLRSFDGLTYIEVLDDLEPELTVDVAKTPEGAYLLDGFCAGKRAEIQNELSQQMLIDTLALLPNEVQSAMIENDVNNLLESEGM